MKETLKKIFRLKDHPEASHIWDPEKVLEQIIDDYLYEMTDIVLVFKGPDSIKIAHSAMHEHEVIGLLEMGKEIALSYSR